jgi:hypothetical protein
MVVVMAWSPGRHRGDSVRCPAVAASFFSLLSVDGTSGRTGGSTGESEPVDACRGLMRVLTDTSAASRSLGIQHSDQGFGCGLLIFVK